MVTARVIAAVLVLAVGPAVARDNGQYEGVPWEIRQWYRDAELTPEARARFPFVKCCDKSDVFRTKFQVNKTTGGDEWLYLAADGEWKRIPPDIVHEGEHAPDGQPTLFIYNGQETCFFPGDSGG